MKRIYERVRIEIIICDNTYETNVLSISGERDYFDGGSGNGGERDYFGSGGGSIGERDTFN